MRSSRCAEMTGVALVSVLWVLVLLSLLAMNLSQISRSQSVQAANLVQAEQLRLLADSGLQWALWNLQRPREQQWLADGSPYRFELEGAEIRAALYDDAGKVDLNKASAPLLRNLLEEVGATPADAVDIADAILDWRDPDQLRQLNGAEAAEYLAAGLSYVPANEEFTEVAEVRLVLGMTADLYRALRFHITTDGGSSAVNPAFASLAVLRAVLRDNPLAAELYVEQRREQARLGLAVPPPPAGGGVLFSSSRQGINYTVHVSVLRNGRRVRMQASLERSNQAGSGAYRVLTRRWLDQPVFPPDGAQSWGERP